MKTTTRGLLRNSTQQGPALMGENKGENCSNPELCLTITMRYNADGPAPQQRAEAAHLAAVARAGEQICFCQRTRLDFHAVDGV